MQIRNGIPKFTEKMNIQREIALRVSEALLKFPVVAVMGPRQSGKTTLCRMIRGDYTYVNLEDLSQRDFAKQDPIGFLSTFAGGVVIDEIQHAPDLFSYLQVAVDRHNQNGQYLITGSQHFLLSERIAQSLAGRVAIFNLLPFSVAELRAAHFRFDDWEPYLLSGGFPRKWLNGIDAFDYYENYLRTYVERDVRLIKNILNLDAFQRFIRLLAGRVGQLFNQSALGCELGIDNKTIHSWMNLLEVSFIAFRLQPYYNNFSKRIVKTPKVYFYDTGLLSYLLGIRSIQELELHFARGQLFENYVILEKMKIRENFGTHERFFFWRETGGCEVDLLIEDGLQLNAVEVKSAKTIHPDFFKCLEQFRRIKPEVRAWLVYGGGEFQQRSQATVMGFTRLGEIRGGERPGRGLPGA